MTRYPFLTFKSHKASAINPRLLTIAGTIWLCYSRQCTPSPLWMHAPVAKERRSMTSQYPAVDRTDNLNLRRMQAVNGWLCGLLERFLCILINYIMINNEHSAILLTACKRRKLKLFGDSPQVRALGNGITSYWSAIKTLQCDILALVWLFGPANVTFWTCQCDFRPWGCFLPVAPSPAN